MNPLQTAILDAKFLVSRGAWTGFSTLPNAPFCDSLSAICVHSPVSTDVMAQVLECVYGIVEPNLLSKFHDLHAQHNLRAVLAVFDMAYIQAGEN